MKGIYFVALACLGVTAASAPCTAQPMQGGVGRGHPVFFDNLFTPRLIMRHQSAIELSESQRNAITKIIDETQKGLVSAQWDVERESEKLAKLLEINPVDEAAALTQADQVMAAEQRLKKAHLTQLIRIKSALTLEQQSKLRELRTERGRRRSAPQ